MEKYFELAKPSTGFRMSQPQIDMLRNARSWMQSAQGKLFHATNGTWFGDKQRQEIVQTMDDLAAAKRGPENGGGGAGAAQKVYTDAEVQAAVQAHPGMTAAQIEKAYNDKGYAKAPQ